MFITVPINGQTWLICGGRDFDDRAMLWHVMGDLLERYGCPAKVVHGGARGADELGAEWGREKAVDVVECKADWKAHGRAAGPIRNQQMLDDYKPRLVVAFPGGKGTADMVRRASETDAIVVEVKHT